VEIIKTFNIRIPKSMWQFLRRQSIDQEKSMNVIVLSCLEKYKKLIEKRVDAE
jgi:predicted HicB family RNase H-like nuclease